MPSRLSTAALVSILAITSGPRGAGSTPSRLMSCAERTKLSATMSTPTSTNASSSFRSSDVGAVIRRRSEGMCSPGRPRSRPPNTTRAFSESASLSSTTATTLPSPNASRSPGLRSATRVSYCTSTRSAVLPVSPLATVMRSPSVNVAPSSPNDAHLTFGPGRSTSMPSDFLRLRSASGAVRRCEDAARECRATC